MALLTGKIQDAILRIEFRDGTSKNSFSVRAADELRELWEAKSEQYGAIVFSAPGRVFCSGGNLADYAAMTSANPGRDVNRRISQTLDAFSKLEVPTVCVVHGDCLGGGLELISAFDLVVSSPNALFGFWQRKIALTFGWGGGRRLERRVGSKKLTQMALTAATFASSEALRIGLIDAICIESLLYEEALSRAKDMLSLPKTPLAPIKNWTADNEQETFEDLWWNDEHRAVLEARKK